MPLPKERKRFKNSSSYAVALRLWRSCNPIDTLRQELGFTNQQKLARVVGCAQYSICAAERGENSMAFNFVIDLADALQIHPAKLWAMYWRWKMDKPGQVDPAVFLERYVESDHYGGTEISQEELLREFGHGGDPGAESVSELGGRVPVEGGRHSGGGDGADAAGEPV